MFNKVKQRERIKELYEAKQKAAENSKFTQVKRFIEIRKLNKDISINKVLWK